MDYRLATLLPRALYEADKTEVIDMDLVDSVSRLVVVYEPHNSWVGADATAHPAKCISKIELVDGSDMLFSLNGQETQAVDFYDRGKLPANIMDFLDTSYSKMIYNLNFGRRLFDPELAFDPTKFRNPQLKVSIDIDAGGHHSGKGYLTVLAHLFDEKPASPIGFFMSKELKDYPLGVSSHEQTDLPLDFPYKQLFLRGQKYGTMVQELFDTVKISQDVDRKIPLNHTMLEVLANMVQEWPDFEESILVQCTDVTGNLFYCTPCDKLRFAASQWRTAAVACGVAQYSGAGGRFYHSTSTANCNTQVIARGQAPHAVVPLLPRLEPENGEGYNVEAIKSLKLDVLTTASAAATDSAQVIAQQIRSY